MRRCTDLYRPLVDARLALPYMPYGLDVVLYVGEGHLRQGQPFCEIGRRLSERGVLIHQMHVGRLRREGAAWREEGGGALPVLVGVFLPPPGGDTWALGRRGDDHPAWWWRSRP
jgi:hypothetical protein